MELSFIATAAFGLEALVGRELADLGCRAVVENGRVRFAGDASALCRANLWLRTADRVRLCVGEFSADTFDGLFEQTKALPWADILPRDAAFPVDGKSIRSQLYSVPDCQAIVKKAIVESMKKRHQLQVFPETGPLYRIEVALLKDTATLTIDTSGEGLHKRGYRQLSGEAPLRETLAAAMLMLARWHPDIALLDPFCGSGTIPIEAAWMGQNRAPGLTRHFAAEQWPWIPADTWHKARDEAYQQWERHRELAISGTDIDGQVLKVARENAAMAEVEERIHFQEMPVSDVGSRYQYGKIISNPPYGERTGSEAGIQQIYRELGQKYAAMDTWSCYILTAYPEFERYFGRRASKRRKLYNGRLETCFYQYYGPRPPRRSSQPLRQDDANRIESE